MGSMQASVGEAAVPFARPGCPISAPYLFGNGGCRSARAFEASLRGPCGTIFCDRAACPGA